MASYLNENGHAVISKAVNDAEKRTSGEIVTVLAEQSDSYNDVVVGWSAVLSFAVMSLFAIWPGEIIAWLNSAFKEWDDHVSTGALISLVLLAGVLSFALTWFLLQIDGLRGRIIPAPLKAARVRAQAVKHFKVGAERRTTGRTGILIYLSMAERRAEIVADEAIASKVEAEVWGKAMADMITHIKAGDIAAGLAICVEDVGEVLAQHFPRADDDVNELPDRLIEV